MLHPAILWLDMRGAAAIQRRAGARIFKVARYNTRYLARWIRLTGGAPALSGKDQAAHILFIQQQLLDIFSSLPVADVAHESDRVFESRQWQGV